MIAGLSGLPSIQGGLSENEVVIKTSGGVDYLVKVSSVDRKDMARMDNVSVWCVTRYSQDNGPVLWGGIAMSSRRRFNNLLKIPRLSGRVAIELAHPASQTLLSTRDSKQIAKHTAGLGEKMANTIVMNLDGILDENEMVDVRVQAPLFNKLHPDVRKDIVMAMKSLGFSSHEANESIKLVEQQDDASNIDVATGIKIALQHIRPKVFEMKEA